MDLSVMLEHWVASGIISANQAALIHADWDRAAPPAGGPSTGGPDTTPRGISLISEAMGYLGGVIILVASGLITGQYWTELTTAGRLALAGAVTVVLLAAGAAVRGLGAASIRLRAVLWLAASVAFGAFLALTATDGWGWQDERVAVLIGSGTAALAAILWYVHRHVLQHATVLVCLLTAAGAGTALLPNHGLMPGVAIWTVGAAWLILAWGSVLGPRRFAMILGAVAAVVGAMATMEANWGTAWTLLTILALVLAAIWLRDLVLLAVASVGALVVLPGTMARYFPGVVSAAVALLGVGVLLVAAAILTARRRGTVTRSGRGERWRVGTPASAIAIATAIVVTSTALILSVGLA